MMKRWLAVFLLPLAIVLLGAQTQPGFIARNDCTTLPSPQTGVICSQLTTAGGFIAGSLLKYVGAWQLVGVSEKRAYPAAGCVAGTAQSIWDTPPSGNPSVQCVGINVYKGVLGFYDATATSAQMHDILPADWTTTGGTDVRLYWFTSATSGSAKWTVQFVCTAVNATITDDPPFPSSGSGFNTVTTAAPSTASRVQTSSIVGVTLPASCVSQTPLILNIRLFRDGADAADTIGQDAMFVWMELTYRRMG